MEAGEGESRLTRESKGFVIYLCAKNEEKGYVQRGSSLSVRFEGGISNVIKEDFKLPTE